MDTTIRGHNIRARVMMTLLAVLLLLAVGPVFVLRPAPITSDRDVNPANLARSVDSTGGLIITQGPYLERHADVVERLGNGSLR
jgi:hypothetical protein